MSYIEREAAMEALYRAINADADGVCNRCPNDPHNCQYNREYTLMDFCEKIEYLGYVPAADVRPVVRGRWEKISKSLYSCSECHTCIIDERVAGCFHCPNCGANMMEEEK